MSYEEFLTILNPDRKIAEERYNRIFAKLTSYFDWNNCSDPEDCADDTINRLINRPPDEPITNIEALIFGIAKNVKYERLRRPVFVLLQDERCEEPTATESKEGSVEELNECMRQCLSAIEATERDVVSRYYSSPNGTSKAKYRSALAESLGISGNALRIRVNRVRTLLRECLYDCKQKNGKYEKQI